VTPRTKRRRALVARQLALGRIARREALGGLAGALAEEKRSRALAVRSRDMAAEYAGPGGHGGAQVGAALAGRLRFAGALVRLAGEAEARGEEAAREAGCQARALAAAERRLEMLEARAASARRAEEMARERREDAAAGPLARKLQRSS